MPNRQFYTMKFKSSRLKKFNYEVSQTFDEAKENGEIIALADNQFLRSIRDIHNRHIDKDELERLFNTRDKLKRLPHSEKNKKRIKDIQDKINQMMFIPEYVTIVMEHKSHYKYLFDNGLIINGKKYVRFSCSASQARVSTVLFCEEETAKKLKEIFDNGRDKNVKLNASKFNAYLGVSGSATHVVSEPRFCVVKDYEIEKTIKADFVTETDFEEDDIIETKTVKQEFNRFDGQGLITPEKANKWAKELGLDYIPAQWCIRNNYLKGMLCVFDIHEFCRTENNGNYEIETIYDGETVDLREIDVIISESQFKLWDSYENEQDYIENCQKNNLKWGVSLYTPKETEDVLKMNYQFNQTLNWDKKDIKKVCQKFVDWVKGVSSENIYYTLLFLLGKDTDKDKIEKYLNKNENYWVKSLIVNHNLINDKYIRQKIYKMIETKIKRACLGDIYVDGNFQVLVSDPYAMMQHICGHEEVTGLLGKDEYYSNYWNKKGVKTVNSMRPPLTYRSEHVKLNLVDSKELRKWYDNCYEGIIVNIHGKEVLHWAGADFDYDIIATTSDETVIKGVYENEIPIVYNPPSPGKYILTDKDLYNADLFAFGSIIGQITNKSTSAYAILPDFEEESEEYQTTMNRIKMCTKLQNAQIDKAKIGREVKGIPKKWVNYQKIKDDDLEEVKKEKEFNNKILLNKHPYFFIYLYSDTKRRYKQHREGYDISCRQKFDMSLDELINKKRKKEEERNFLDVYYEFLPVIDSDCVMNNLCKHIESIDFDIKKKIKNINNKELYKELLNNDVEESEERYNQVLNRYKEIKKEFKEFNKVGMNFLSSKNKFLQDGEMYIDSFNHYFQKSMDTICSNSYELTNYLIKIFYIEYPKSNKELLWNVYGRYIFENIKSKNKENVYFPFPDKEGDIEYLNKRYSLEEVVI